MIYSVLLDQNKIQNKPTSKSNYHFMIEANNMTILDETENMHGNPQDDTLNVSHSYNTPQISLTDKI